MNDTKNKSNRGRKPLDSRAYEVATRIREIREKNGLKLSQVAKSLNLSPATYFAWEKQFGIASERKHLYKLVDFYQVSPEWFSHGIVTESHVQLNTNPDVEANKFSLIVREKLAERAKARRNQIQLTARDLAALIDTKKSNIYLWESLIPLTLNIETQKLWEKSLQVPEGWLIDININTPIYDQTKLNKINPPSNIPSTIAAEIRIIGTWLAIPKVNKRTLDFQSLNDLQKRAVNIFAERYGVNGETNSILQMIGDKYQLTRERVRQITEKMVNQTAHLQVDTPCLDQLMSDIHQHLPDTIKSLDARYNHLLGEQLSVLSVDRFSREILGKKMLVLTENPADMAIPWNRIAISPYSHEPETFKVFREISHKMIRACGAANIYYVLGDAIRSLGKGITLEDALKVIRVIPGFEWLVEEDGWYWFGYNVPIENKFLVVTRKILAVAGRRVDVEDLLNGLIRNRREKYDDGLTTRVPAIEPPLTVLIAVLSRTPWLKTIQSDDAIAAEPILPKDYLSGAELKICEYLIENKGIASRNSLTKELVDKNGMNFVTLGLALDSSPIIVRLDTGIFALRGYPLNDDSLKNAINTVWGQRSPRVLVNLEPDLEGWVNYESILDQYSIKTRMFSISNAFGRYLVTGDEFAVDGFTSPVVFKQYENGTCRLNGLLHKLLKLKFKQGDLIQIKINKTINRLVIKKTSQS